MKFEKLNLEKFKKSEISSVSKLFGGQNTVLTATICTKRTDSSDTGHADPSTPDTPGSIGVMPTF